MIEFFRQLQHTGLLWPVLLFWTIVLALGAWTAQSPVFQAELLTSGRKNRQFLVRVIYALALAWVLWMTYEQQFDSWRFRDAGGLATHKQMAEFAHVFYTSFSWVQLIAVLLVTPAMVGGAIAAEREQKTIEYLFASDLTDVEIVLGKLGIKVLQLGLLLLTALPVLAIATLFGGISAKDLVIAFSVAFCSAASLAGLALILSIWSRRARDAVVGTYLVELAFLVLPGLLQGLNGWLPQPYDAAYSCCTDLLVDANPIVLLGRDIWGFAGNTWTRLYLFAVIHLVFGLLAVAWATFSLRRAHRRLVGAGEGAKTSRKWLPPLPRWRPGVLDDAMLWKEAFAERWRLGWAATLALWAVLFAVVVIQAFQYFGSGWPRGRGELGVMWSTLTACCLLLVQGARASMSISSERERDTWLSLLGTPLTARDIVGAKFLGSIASVRWLELLLPYGWLLAFAKTRGDFLPALPFHVVTIGVLTCFVSALGVYVSLRCQSSTRAVCVTVGILILLGGAYVMCCIPCMFGGGPGDGAVLMMAPCMLFLLAGSAIVGLEGLPRHDQGVGVALVFGIILYAVATFVLLALACDRLAKKERGSSLGEGPLLGSSGEAADSK